MISVDKMAQKFYFLLFFFVNVNNNGNVNNLGTEFLSDCYAN